MFLILFLYMLFASTFTIGKAVLAYVDPIFFIAVRMLLAGILLFLFLRIKKRSTVIKPEDKNLFIQLIFFHIYIAYVLEFKALEFVASSKACLLYSLSPFITALFERFYLRSHLTPKKIIGLTIGFAGFLPILMASAPLESFAGSISFVSVPELQLIVAIVSSVYGWLLFKKLMHKGYSPIMVNAVGMLGGGFLALVTSLVLEGKPVIGPLLGSESVLFTKIGSFLGLTVGMVPFIIYTILIIIIANVLAYNLYGKLLGSYSATFLSFAGITCPMFAALFGWFFLGESISKSFFVSLFVVFWGLYIFYQEELN